MRSLPRTAEGAFGRLSSRAVLNETHYRDGLSREARSSGFRGVGDGTPPANTPVSQEGETTMKRQLMIILTALAAATAGCHKDNPNSDALQTDLNLANQANSQRSLDSISAAERGYASPSPAATAPSTASRASTRSYTPARRSRSSSSSGSYGTAPAPAPTRTTVQKNTKRDAAIGAAAGAIIGAAASHDKVKGGIIGAAAGGILGGVIGNNVDVKKKKP